MSMRTYEELRKMLCEELDEIVQKGSMSAGDLDMVFKLTGSIKNVDKIEMAEEYSQDGGWNATGTYSRTGDGYYNDESYRRGNSYANRGMHYVRGHYSRYSSAEGREELGHKIEEMMEDDSLSMKERNALKMALETIRSGR